MSDAFNPEASLPKDREFFSVGNLADLWSTSVQHIINLVESGELEAVVDLKGKKASKSMLRVPRQAIVKFLKKRERLP